ncbi:MAG: hypothetical protein JXR37_26155 [Kiritimatiellae bacterium]|nr:hypothetical protein [Kiritimatiellia bacterium]
MRRDSASNNLRGKRAIGFVIGYGTREDGNTLGNIITSITFDETEKKGEAGD